MSNANPYADLNLQLFETAAKEFKYHLQAEYNSRIIFSGKFGHGKTTFLKWFFDQKEQKGKYNVIRLFPVNYSVASNEDIFEYIKYDIMVELLDKGYEVKSLDPSEWKLASFYVKDNPLKVVSFLAKRLPKVGKSIGDFIDELSVLKNDFEKYCEEANNAQEEKKIAEDFLKELENETGSLYEKDAITELIKLLVWRGPANQQEAQKETILIIDDLDRIDPEHIFRILNVFAAHFDLDSGENKFGFDKVMVVCDIENIRNIFKAKYGADTDFNGYIDKFYSHKVFTYDIVDAFVDFAVGNLSDAGIRLGNRPEYRDEATIVAVKDSLIRRNEFLSDMLTVLMDARQIDLRNIVKWKGQTVLYGRLINIEHLHFTDVQYKYGFTLQLLADLKGSVSGLKDAVNNIKSISRSNFPINDYSKQLAVLFTIKHHENNAERQRSFTLNLGKDDLLFRYGEGRSHSFLSKSSGNYINYEHFTVDEFKNLLIKVIDMLAAHRVL